MKKSTTRGYYVHLSRAWYGAATLKSRQDGLIDDVLFKLDSHPGGELCCRWENLQGAEVPFHEWLESREGAGFELLQDQSITTQQIQATKRWLRHNRDVVTLKVLSCTIEPKCLSYSPPCP